jgi:hypothetical protein
LQIEKAVDRLDAFTAIRSCQEVPPESVSSPLHKNQPWDNDIGLFGFKIVKDVVRTFLKEAASTVLPPDLLYSDGNHNVNSIFHRFHVFHLQQLF